MRRHPDFPELERLLRESPALRRARLPRAAYALLDEPRLEPRFLGNFRETYRLPASPFFSIFLAIKRERKAGLEGDRARRGAEIEAMARRFPREALGFMAYLESAERQRHPGAPLFRKKLFPRSKKRAGEMARLSLAQWIELFAAHIAALRAGYRRIALPDTDSLIACMLLERYPDPATGRLPSAATLRAQFRRLSMIHHPDRGGDATRFRLLVKARDRLIG